MSNFLASQILVGFAFACAVASMQCRQRRSLLFWLVLASLLSASHFFLLGRVSAGTLYVILWVRLLAATRTTDRRVMMFFAVAVIIGAMATYERPLDGLAMVAALTATYAAFQADARRMRIVYMLCAAQWMIHNVIAGSPVAVAMEATILLSNMLGFWRHYIRATPEPPPRPDR
ncbi:MAG: YgjV family protein [Gemmatimonadetes bacterium]|jgi:hypothetical protein|nr:YgjV family protein [Gemmatimonadota bacterium]MBT6147315.1 YgjV family protein [Gemmatimonadota bacterium]MBT7861285.1 YgjV family protein [Gemmatimonadota bacterium]